VILVPSYSEHPFRVTCDAKTQGGGWTIILRRMDGSVDFYRNWTAYKNGFGDMDGEIFLGLDKIHALTTERKQELLVVFEDFEGDEKYELYDEFAIGDGWKTHTHARETYILNCRRFTSNSSWHEIFYI